MFNDLSDLGKFIEINISLKIDSIAANPSTIASNQDPPSTKPALKDSHPFKRP